jgi:hypothetical protein
MIWLFEYDNKKSQEFSLWRLGKDKQWVWCLSGGFLPWSAIKAHLAWTRSERYLSDKDADSKLKAVKAMEENNA